MSQPIPKKSEKSLVIENESKKKKIFDKKRAALKIFFQHTYLKMESTNKVGPLRLDH